MIRLHVALSLAAAAFTLAGCAPARQGTGEAPRSVTAVPARRQTIAISQEYAARIRAHQEIVVSAKISGRVASTRADVGQRVAKGQALFALEAKDSEAQYRQAKAALESAYSSPALKLTC